MKLTIKEEFKGLNISRNVLRLGAMVTFDTQKDYTQKELAVYFRFDEFKSYIQEESEEVEVKEYKGITPGVVLTDADALADLNGEPRPDNPGTEEFTGIASDLPTCKVCGNDITDKRKKKYCSTECKNNAKK